MKYDDLVAKDKDVFTTPLFKLSILIPCCLALIVGFGISYNDNFSSLLGSLWATMKLPIALASLSLPLATWVIANHRSAQLLKSAKLQESKRLVETYLEQEAFFERVYGRKLVSAGWEYITKEDLPVIHAQLYEFERLQVKNSISPRGDMNFILDAYFNNTRKLLWDFYEIFTKEKEQENNSFQIDSYCHQLFENLNYTLMIFASEFGTRHLKVDTTKLSLYLTAYFEIYNLSGELKIRPTDFQDVLDDDFETFNAVINIIIEHYQLYDGDITLERLRHSIGIRNIVRYFAGDAKSQNVNSLMQSWAKNFKDRIEGLNVFPVDDDKHLSLKLWTNDPDVFIKVKFEQEIDEKPDRIVFSINAAQISIPIQQHEGSFRLCENDKKLSKKLDSVMTFIYDNLDFKVAR
ncbi:hypothetical protein RUK64_003573 [Vibrio cholerae]|nr:hypothetical protein [Vibrio cholerae]ELJ8695672.1 hypothetical protein [Vibrio cholerae]